MEQKEKLEAKYPVFSMLTGDTVGNSLKAPFTVRQWLDYSGHDASIKECQTFGKLMANTKRTMVQMKQIPNNNCDTKLYSYDDLEMLEASWKVFKQTEDID